MGTAGDDTIAATANGSAVTVSGLGTTVDIAHADVDSDKLAIDPLAGNDDVSVDPAVNALIQVSD